MILRRLAYGFSSIALSLSSLFVLASPVAHAAGNTCVWSGATDLNFSTATNWTGCGSAAPTDGDILSFSTGTGTITVNNDLTNLSVAGIVGGGDIFYITGNKITLTGDVVINDNGGTDSYLYLNTNIDLAADVSFIANSGSSSGTSAINATGNIDTMGHSLTISGNAWACAVNFSATLIGSGAIIVNASGGSLNFSGTSPNFSGALNLVKGNVGINGPTALGNTSGVTVSDGAMIGVMSGGNDVSYNFPLTVGGTGTHGTGGALNTNGGTMCKGMAGSETPKTVTLNGPVTLTSDIAFAGSDNLKIAGTYTDNGHVITVLSGNAGSVILPTGTVETQPVSITVASDDLQPASSVTIGNKQTYTINGERGSITVNNGGTLKGSGKVGNVWIYDGTVAPGNSPGVLNTGNISYSSGVLSVEVGGTGAGEYDQLNVTGTVDLGTSVTTLTTSLWNNFAPTVGQSYTIINNDSNDAVTGTFVGMADDSSFTQNGVTYTINYNGGDGNDVVLTVTAVPATATAPNTGFEQLKNNPLLTLVMTLVAVAGISFAARKQFTDKK